jgi:hypothetical protein
MPKLIRVMPLAAVLVSYAVSAALLWLANDALRWAHIVLLAAAIALVTRPSKNLPERVFGGLSIGVLISLLLVGVGLACGWVKDRQHFLDDGGPVGALFVTEFYVGLPMIVLAMVLSGLAHVRSLLSTNRLLA